jgi:hypothetical protein
MLDYAEIKSAVILVSLLRLNRVLLIGRVNVILSLITSKYPNTIKIISLIKSFGMLFFVWHLSSTMWMWFNLYVILTHLIKVTY